MGPLVPLAITLLIQSFSSLALVAVPVLSPALGGMPRLSAAAIGLYLVCGYGGAIVGSLSAGACVERWGAIRVSRYALKLSALGLMIAAWWPVAMPLAAFLIGGGYGPITPASSHLLIQSTPPERRSFVFSVKQTGVPLGVALTGLIVPPMAPVFDWGWTLTVLAAACAIVAMAALPVQAELDGADAEQRRARVLAAKRTAGFSFANLAAPLVRPLALIFSHRDLRAMAAVSFLFSCVQMSFAAYIVTYLTQDLAVAAVLAGAMLAISQGGGVAGRIAWGYLADRVLGALPMLLVLAILIVLCALTTAALPLLGGVPPMLMLAALMLLFGGTASGWNGVYLAEVAARAPQGQAGLATAGTLACTFFGVIIGAPSFGMLASGTGGFQAAFALLAVFAGVAATLLVVLIRRNRRS
jgi:predicted MFS family arabinose efflux permease